MSWVIAAVLLLVSNVLYWKYRIIDTATKPELCCKELATLDLYTEHHPMAVYGFEVLGDGGLPLWNPYQLVGQPFLAVPHTGIFYPGNLGFLLTDAALATEITLVAHLLLACLGMWALARELRLGTAAGFAAAVTFAWSGWMTYYVNQSALVSGMCWLPVTVWLIERGFRGSDLACLGLAIATACQVLNGATEMTVMNAYVAAAYLLFRLGTSESRGEAFALGRRAGLLIGAAATGVLLSSVQLLPSLELVGQSVRGTDGAAELEQIPAWGRIAPVKLLNSFLGNSGEAAVGVLPLLGLAAGFGPRRLRKLWVWCVTGALLTAAIATGGNLAEWYYLTPIGGLFRTPEKFLHLSAFFQALLAGIGVACLASWSEMGRNRLWRSPNWILALGSLTAAAAWVGVGSRPGLAIWGVLAVLLVFAIKPRLSVPAAVVLAGIQATGLFLHTRTEAMRPFSQPEAFDASARLLTWVRDEVGHDRVYLEPRLRVIPRVTLKQGMMRRLPISVDYEALSTGRSAAFFRLVSGPWHWPPLLTPKSGFHGYYQLGPRSRWKLMALTSTRFYLTYPNDPLDRFLAEEAIRAPELTRLVPSESWIGTKHESRNPFRLYERSGGMPRAYYVPEGIIVQSADEALARLSRHDFDPSTQVVLEEPAVPRGTAAGGNRTGRATIQILEPERVVVDVATDKPGYLVLTDAYYPGWNAYIGERQVPIMRANYLFRAVALGAGATRVTFRFEPRSLYAGSALSASAAALLFAAWLVRSRGRRRDSTPELSAAQQSARSRSREPQE